jgi:hypothetical protein
MSLVLSIFFGLGGRLVFTNADGSALPLPTNREPAERVSRVRGQKLDC